MKLSLRDKVSLIYTLAGSQRGIASLVGVSHQKIGRILHAPEHGGYAPNSRALTDPGLIAAVNQAFEIHRQVCKSQAVVHGLPYSSAVPIFYERKPLRDGTLGDRVAALHTHWVSDELKATFLAIMQRSGRFAAASLGSVVDLVVYSRRADKMQGRKYRDNKRINDKISIQNKIEQNVVQGPIYTKYTPMDPRLPLDAVLSDIFGKLNQKHAPAVTGPGTLLATTILMQVDTRKDTDGRSKDHDWRVKHPATKYTKARGNQKRTRKR